MRKQEEPTTIMLELPATLRDATIERRLVAHEDLFLQGRQATQLLSIVSGRVKLWRAAHDGTACTLLLLGRGELLGSVAVAQDAPHLTSATALDPVIVAAWPARLFRQVVQEDRALAQSFLLAVARRAVQLMDRFDDVAGLTVEAKLARLLLRLSGEFGRHIDDLAIAIDIRQQDLAELAYTTVPTVSRTLANWKAQNLVLSGRGHIVIPHLAALAQVAGIHLD